MIKGLRFYARGEAWPRRRRILLGSDALLALALGAGAYYFGGTSITVLIKAGALSSVLLTYASIALGFTLAGFTLCLTLPDKDFAKKLVGQKARDGSDAYSDLLFAFSWAALAHWLLIVTSVVFLLTIDSDAAVLSIGAPRARRAGVAALVALSAYGFLNFLIVLITLSQAGAVYIRHVKDCPHTR